MSRQYRDKEFAVLGKSKSRVILYSTPACPVCKRAKEYLARKGVSYEEVDVSTDRKAAGEMVKKSGQMGVPVIFIGDTMLVGFNPLKIDVALKK
jgi:glutaredoxin-like YruB-family protein